MKVNYSRAFRKQYEKLPEKTKIQFKERVSLFLNNPTHASLRVHKLNGEYEGLRSINITGDVRAIFDKSYKGLILFIAIGTHSELYF